MVLLKGDWVLIYIDSATVPSFSLERNKSSDFLVISLHSPPLNSFDPSPSSLCVPVNRPLRSQENGPVGRPTETLLAPTTPSR